MPTIDDIPLNSHNEWAKRVEQQRKEPLQYGEDYQVVGPAQVDVSAPSYPSQLESLLGEDLCNIPWSDFSMPPKELLARRTTCFSTDLIPRLGSDEKLRTLKQKLDSMAKIELPPSNLAESMKWEEEKARVQYDIERKTLSNAVEKTLYLNKILYDINAKIHEYHKG